MALKSRSEMDEQYMWNFADIYADEIAQGKEISGDEFVEDCAVESDLEMYFPETYVPGSSERMLLYRELDNIDDDQQLDNYRQRLADRFGKLPPQGEELLQVVPLRRIGKRLGCEKIILKQGAMQMQFVSNIQSPFYKSAMFSKVLNYITVHVQQCALKEKNGKRLLRISQVPSVKKAVQLLMDIEK